MIRASATIASLLASLATPLATQAQPLGTFRWQLQPYCNIVSVVVTQTGGVYGLDGTDDQCGGDQASVVGTAFQNPGGTIGFGLTIVATPGGSPVHVEAEITLASLGGTWRDSAGNTGAFVLTPGAGTGGSPRPTTGTIGALSVHPSQVQLRISGSCGNGQFMRAINENGSVTCGPAGGGGGGTITGVLSGPGLVGGGTSGTVSVGLPLIGSGAFLFDNVDGFVATGVFGTGTLGHAGPGTRAVWYPRKAAFRAGWVRGGYWDDSNIGPASVAFNLDTTASGSHSAAFGENNVASGISSVAMGGFTTASGHYSFAMGSSTMASGTQSVAMGTRVTAAGAGSVVLGSDAVTLAASSGTFIFADRSTTNDITGFAPNEFIVRAAGGVGFYTNAALTSGVEMAAGGSSWMALSDKNMKDHFRDLSGEDVLEKLSRMPIQEWSYKSQDASIRHVGPTAQDFHAAFGLGENPLRINTIDADGIALAAVRALEARTRELREENASQRQEMARLRARLTELEQRLARP